jgi:hypothetical protein
VAQKNSIVAVLFYVESAPPTPRHGSGLGAEPTGTRRAAAATAAVDEEVAGRGAMRRGSGMQGAARAGVLLGRLTRTTDTAPGPARLKERLRFQSTN